MTLVSPKFNTSNCILEQIQDHPAWLGNISGLKAEKMLKAQKKPWLYVLRAGEHSNEMEADFYVTFVTPDYHSVSTNEYRIHHQPFVITKDSSGTWSYQNNGGGGGYTETTTIEDILHLIMHCPVGMCAAYIYSEKK